MSFVNTSKDYIPERKDASVPICIASSSSHFLVCGCRVDLAPPPYNINPPSQASDTASASESLPGYTSWNNRETEAEKMESSYNQKRANVTKRKTRGKKRYISTTHMS